jgi:arylsulfatase A-like enzyme
MAWLSNLLSSATLASAAVLSAAEIPTPRPNIVVVLTDDIGWGDFRCYQPGSRIPTPAVDALVATGMRFTDAHAPSAVCAPTRYSMLTGNYPWRGRTTTGAWNLREGSDLQPGQKTFGQVALEAGYRTAFLGKAGIGTRLPTLPDGKKPDWSKPLSDGPRQWGFTFSHILLQGHQASPYFFHRDGVMVGDPARVVEFPKPKVAQPETDIRFGGPGLPDWDPRTVGETLLDAADVFLDQAGTGPFLLYLNTAGAHGPYTPPGTIRGTQVRGVSGLSAKADMVVEADVVIGHLVASLTRRGLLNGTCIAVTSDNGGVPDSFDYKEQQSGHDPVNGLRGGKSLVWEGGHRVPLIVRWGDGSAEGSRIAPGSLSDRLVGIQDLYATIADLIGAPADPTQGLDSISLLPELTGRPGARREDFIASSDFRYNRALDEGEDAPTAPLSASGVDQKQTARAYRAGTWSLIFDKDARAVALHDLAADPGQKRNLINDPAQAERIAALLAAYAARCHEPRTAPLAPTP